MTAREEIARRLAAWLGYAWEGLHERSVVERGYPEWSFDWSNCRKFQGGQADLLKLADELIGLAGQRP